MSRRGHGRGRGRRRRERIKRNSKTISTLATVSIPIVIAIFGYFANRSLQQDRLDRSCRRQALETDRTASPLRPIGELVRSGDTRTVDLADPALIESGQA